jgi:hypothetical protein
MGAVMSGGATLGGLDWLLSNLAETVDHVR